MASRYLLDTNILSDLMRNPGGEIGRKIAALSIEERDLLSTSVVVACELRYGAVKRRSVVLKERVRQLLENIIILALEPSVDEHYGRLRAELEEKGTLISANDMLIAAHALSLDAILVTDNIREFRRVKGLRVENWLRH
jgi:tRNA(fMet)-specific endonuclease VapC